MTDEEKVLELLKNSNGIIKTSLLKKENISKMSLTRLVQKGLIERIERGLYIDNNIIEDNYVVFQHICNKAIFSHSTALYFHQLSDRTPIKLMSTVPSNYNSRLLKDNNYVFFYLKEELYEIGKTKIKTPFQNEVYCYDLERTICDIIRNKDKIDASLFSDAMKRYVERKDKNIIKLYEYAEKLNIIEKVKNYMEVLM